MLAGPAARPLVVILLRRKFRGGVDNHNEEGEFARFIPARRTPRDVRRCRHAAFDLLGVLVQILSVHEDPFSAFRLDGTIGDFTRSQGLRAFVVWLGVASALEGAVHTEGPEVVQVEEGLHTPDDAFGLHGDGQVTPLEYPWGMTRPTEDDLAYIEAAIMRACDREEWSLVRELLRLWVVGRVVIELQPVMPARANPKVG